MLKKRLVILLVVLLLVGGFFYFSQSTTGWEKIESDLREMNFSENELEYFKSCWERMSQQEREEITEFINNEKEVANLLD